MYREAAERGMAFFDEREEDGWRDRIDLGRLDISRGQDCMTGQITGIFDFRTAREKYGLSEDQAYNMGLNVRPEILAEDFEGMEKQTAAWVDLFLKARTGEVRELVQV